jgi:hypothetical protein
MTYVSFLVNGGLNHHINNLRKIYLRLVWRDMTCDERIEWFSDDMSDRISTYVKQNFVSTAFFRTYLLNIGWKKPKLL